MKPMHKCSIVDALLCCALLAGGCDDGGSGVGGSTGGTGDAATVDAGDRDGGGDASTNDGGESDAGGSGGEGGGGGGGGGGDTDAETCGASPFEADRVAVNLLLVVDKSGSMDGMPDGFSTDKWTALTGALETSLGEVQDDLRFGLDLYPDGDGEGEHEACEVPAGDAVRVEIGDGISHVEKVVTELQGITPAGSTPTAAALGRALSFYTTGDGASLQGKKYVLLATDGGPNCNADLSCEASACTVNLEDRCGVAPDNCCDPDFAGPGAGAFCLDDQATLAAVQALADAAIPTVVVGIPGSEAFSDVLDALAVAGGVTSDGDTDYFAVTADGTGAGSLSEVLGRVTRQLIRTCDLQLASDPPDVELLNVEVDGEIVPQDGPDGWDVDESSSPPTIRLKGATCEQIETEGAESVDVTYGCPTIVVI